MIRFAKPLTALSVVGALMVPTTIPSHADPIGAAAAGFAAGAAIAGAAIVGAATDPYDAPGYFYDPYDSYAYARGDAGPGVTVYVNPGDPYAAAPGAYQGGRYSPAEHGYDSNYIGPWKERQLEGRNY